VGWEEIRGWRVGTGAIAASRTTSVVVSLNTAVDFFVAIFRMLLVCWLTSCAGCIGTVVATGSLAVVMLPDEVMFANGR
jgi:hypothetical protein